MLNWAIDKSKGISKISINRSELDIDKTLNCGQAFRWFSVRDGFWFGVLNKRVIVLKQTLGMSESGEENDTLSTNITDEQELNQLEQYLNLDMSYTKEVESLNLKELDPYAYECYEVGAGIHILRQDLYEMMVTFLMSQFNSMHNIRIILDKLSRAYGKEVKLEWIEEYGENRGISTMELTYYTFPSVDELVDVKVSDYEKCSMGFRAEYMYNMIQKLYNEKDILDNIKQSTNPKILLKQFNGIGDKVANCIDLFALHNLSAFPVDVHIKRIISREYKGSIDISRYGSIAGLIQQYMYYKEAFNK